MEALFRSLDPLAAATILFPIVLCCAAWGLRMACAICAVRVPDFVPAAAVIVVCVVTNLGLRILLNINGMSLGLTSQLLLVLLSTATIIAFSVRTSIASAIAVTITQVFLCAVMFYGLNEVGQLVL